MLMTDIVLMIRVGKGMMNRSIPEPGGSYWLAEPSLGIPLQ